MRQLLLLGITVLSLSLGSPVATRANEIEETATAAQFEKALLYVTDTYTKYSNDIGVNIRKQPNTYSDVLGKTLLNTEFEVVLDINGWSMITTSDGFAYIKSEYLSDSQVTNRWNIRLDSSEKDMLCRIVMLEAGGESDKGQQAVAEVILNRMVADEWPNTLYGVLSEPKQFSTWKKRNRVEVSERVKENVNSVLCGETDVLPLRTVYFSREGENRRVQRVIGGHIFCNQ